MGCQACQWGPGHTHPLPLWHCLAPALAAALTHCLGAALRAAPVLAALCPWLPALLRAQPWGSGWAEPSKFHGRSDLLTLAVCVALPATLLVAAHLGWGTVLVLAAPLLLGWLQSGCGRAGVPCTAEQDGAGGEDRAGRWPAGGGLVSPASPGARPGATWCVPVVAPTQEPQGAAASGWHRQSPPQRARSDGPRRATALCLRGLWPHGITPGPQHCLCCLSSPISPAGAGGRHCPPQLPLQHF